MAGRGAVSRVRSGNGNGKEWEGMRTGQVELGWEREETTANFGLGGLRYQPCIAQADEATFTSERRLVQGSLS